MVVEGAAVVVGAEVVVVAGAVVVVSEMFSFVIHEGVSIFLHFVFL